MLGFELGSMRVAVTFLLAGMVWVGGADASSFVTLAPMQEQLGPSMVEIGEKQVSPSVVALGEPEVTSEKVAAIGGETQRKRPGTTPMVLRGGMPGDPFIPALSAPAAGPQTGGQQAGDARAQASGQPRTASAGDEPTAPPAPATPSAPTIKPQ